MKIFSTFPYKPFLFLFLFFFFVLKKLPSLKQKKKKRKEKKRKRRCFEISIINPKSQSFFQSYGSILPSSLTYIILLTRGCSPWRPAAVMSTTKWENYSLPLIFKDRQERTNIWNTFFFNEKKKKTSRIASWKISFLLENRNFTPYWNGGTFKRCKVLCRPFSLVSS